MEIPIFKNERNERYKETKKGLKNPYMLNQITEGKISFSPIRSAKNYVQ